MVKNVGNLEINYEELGGGGERVYQLLITSKVLDSRIGRWGVSMTYVARPTANCQLASIRNAHKLTKFNQTEFNDLVSMFRSRSMGGIQKQTLLIDVYAKLRPEIAKKVKAAGGRILMSRKYLNNTGSEMVIMILDLTKRNAHGKAC